MSRRPRVYLAYTGGTIGMRQADGRYRPAPGYLAEEMDRMPELRHPDMPDYHIREYDRLLDSSNMTPADWQAIGEDLLAHHDDYDGFVVLHGTDTMAYTASALSFLFENLAKPVVFTGSQIPLEKIRNDARDNLITSLLVAGRYPLPEVVICFGDRLLRGNRSTKVSASDLRAFDSPNHPHLGSVGVRIRIHEHLLLPRPTEPLHFHPLARAQVADVRLFPGMTPETLRQFLEPPLQGAVLHTYGLGNAPDDPAFLEVLRRASDRGVVLVNCTQCLEGSVRMDDYATGRGLLAAGVVSGHDMTPEAALTKLYAVLSAGASPDEARRLMPTSLRGELTEPTG